MKDKLKDKSTEEKLSDPVKITQPEPWQWEVMAKAFLDDPVLKFWLGKKHSEPALKDFFEVAVKDALKNGGSVFSSPDRKAVIIWRLFEYGPEIAKAWKQQMHEVLGADGMKRYDWLYKMGDVPIDPAKRDKTMLPDYLGVLPDAQGRGYGGHIGKWTLNYFDKQGRTTPYILASTPRSAKLYCPVFGFHVHKEVPMGKEDDAPVAVFLKRNEMAL